MVDTWICEVGATPVPLNKGPEIIYGNRSFENMQLLLRQFYYEM
jgi:hypothetical protein